MSDRIEQLLLTARGQLHPGEEGQPGTDPDDVLVARRTSAGDGNLLQRGHRDVDALQAKVEIVLQAPGEGSSVRAERGDGGGIASLILEHMQAIVAENVKRSGLIEFDAVIVQQATDRVAGVRHVLKPGVQLIYQQDGVWKMHLHETHRR